MEASNASGFRILALCMVALASAPLLLSGSFKSSPPPGASLHPALTPLPEAQQPALTPCVVRSAPTQSLLQCDQAAGLCEVTRLLAGALPQPHPRPAAAATAAMASGAPGSPWYAPVLHVDTGAPLPAEGAVLALGSPLCVYVAVPSIEEVFAYREPVAGAPLVAYNTSSYSQTRSNTSQSGSRALPLAPDTVLIHLHCNGVVVLSAVPDWVATHPASPGVTPSHSTYAFALQALTWHHLPRFLHNATASGALRCQLHTRVEHRSWSWFSSPLNMPAFWPPRPVPGLTEPSTLLAAYNPDILPTWPFAVQAPAPPQPPPTPLPLCNWSLAAQGGHWGTGPAPEGAISTADARFWAPLACRLVQHTAASAAACLGRLAGQQGRKPVLHFLGDSNTRRYLKELSGVLRGQPWCGEGSAGARNERSSKVCLCEDASEFDADYQVEELQEATLVRATLRGVGWEQEVLKALGSMVAEPGQAPSGCPASTPGADTGADAAPPCPAAVFIQMVVWDAAWQSFARLQLGMAALVQRLRAMYPHPGTLLVYRTANHHCCADHEPHLFYTSGRVRLYNAYVRGALEEAFGERLRVLDVYGMGDMRGSARSEALTKSCAGHEPSEDITVENQVLLNALCEPFQEEPEPERV